MFVEKVIDIEKRYSHEILDISNKLKQLEEGRVYEITNYKGDGYIYTNVTQLKEMLNGLLNKIEYNKDSFTESIFPFIK